MKKIFILLTAVFSAALFSSCGFIDFSKDDGSITAPTITYGSDGGSIIITPVHQSGCYYVNVIRYEVDSGSKDASMVQNSTVNIGQIQPTEYYNNHAMTFIDYYTDSNKFYQYYVRYRKADGYTSSQTTISYQGKGTAGSGERELTAVDPSTPVRIDYNSNTFVLTIEKSLLVVSGTHELPETHESVTGTPVYFVPMIGINNGVRTQLFELGEQTINSIDCYQIALGNTLPTAFRDKELKITGIYGQEEFDPSKGAYTSEAPFMNIAWTKPLSDTDLFVDTEAASYFIVKQQVEEPDVYDVTCD
ncbi:hypothetical protein DYE49_11520 [Treponema rectale]|uniref:Lipoprotein n=1 Tax=Treponema rectale TaxID=744512 RepID=A0A840SI13_9SPIR|nr:hypothetical protein [Treponema rectale]MBB5219051.1 hypothetical protein [Treponema rectale]QOS41040.1 hypothetical protein DYE49_11520 [Treponema rectale]